MKKRAQSACEVCSARVGELRRGRCWGCYLRWSEQRPVGRGAACLICGERRYGELRLVELFGHSHPLCHRCAAHTQRLVPMPRSVEGIRERLDRERRRRERREGQRDQRIFTGERRVGERRFHGREDVAWLEDEYVVEIHDTVLEELAGAQAGDLTLIRMAPEDPAKSAS